MRLLAQFWSGSYARTVTLSRGSILCDFDGCWNAMIVSRPMERLIPPVDDIIQHRAWVKGWTTYNGEQDFCSRHHSGGIGGPSLTA